MKIKKSICALALILFAFCALPAGCSAGSSACVLEAEKAIAEPVYDGSVAAEVRANSRSEYITGGGKYIGKMYAGNTITWFFNAERQAECDISIAVANADEQSAGFTAGLGEVFSIRINGRYITVPEYRIPAGTQYCDNWQVLHLGAFTVNPGINEVVYTALSDTERLNVDYLSLSSSRAEVSEHTHFWKTSPTPATCTEDGNTVKTCGECNYSYVSEKIPALGHRYGNYHYDSESQKMVAVCERCPSTLTANTPSSKYFGEVYYNESGFTVKPTELLYEAEDAFVCLDGGLSSSYMDSYIGKDDGTKNNPSGGKCVEGLSAVGNNIRFLVDAEEDCNADLVLVMSNTLYTDDGIAELNPMSDYVYCTVNGVSVDFTFVSFPGFDEHSYFEWRYVVIKDVELSAERNTIEIGPKDNSKRVTMPNTDVLKIYTERDVLKAVKCYDINDITRGGGYDGLYENRLNFRRGEAFTLCTGQAAETADYVITVNAEEEISNLASRLSLTVNDKTVNLEGVALEEGENVLVLHDVAVALLNNTVGFAAGAGIEIISVDLYSPKKIPLALECDIVPENDYIATEGAGKSPSFIFEAEDADLGDSVSSRDGVELLELNVYENTGKKASGNTTIGNFAVKDNTITWKFESSAAVDADIVLMLASANYSESLNGNTSTDRLQDRIVITVNGVAVRLDDIILTVDSLANYYDWKAVTIPTRLLAGANEVVIRALGYGAPNMDVLYVYADGAEFGKI